MLAIAKGDSLKSVKLKIIKANYVKIFSTFTKIIYLIYSSGIMIDAAT